jgi:TRAP transporter TAXI family solute receptor
MVLALMETFGLSPAAAAIVSVILVLFGLAALGWVVFTAPPRHITLTSGPEGSTFERYALAYQKVLAARGLTVTIVPSGGSPENLQRLRDPKSGVDVGFVQGGLTEGIIPKNLVSLGSVAYQPLWLFYRNPAPIQRLSQLAGKKIAVGPIGSGTHALAMTLLAANGVSSDTATLREDDVAAAAAALQSGQIDAVFLMGDSAPIQILRTLIRSDGILMYDWTQADAYVRRYAYLNKMRLPQGSIDLGKNQPAQDVALVGPTVELIVRKGLNSAVSDVLLDAAVETHARPNLLQKAGEFPAPLAHEYKVSDDALRYYKSGKSFLSRVIPSPFWVAGLVNPILVALVPAILVLVPALRLLPILYRMRIHLRIYRCYRPLLQLERDASGNLTRERARELLARLDEVEAIAGRLKVPASFGDQFYDLRGHIAFVRRRLEAASGLSS